tara:strand:+ start:15416 stop:15661 length:246 start_codon:yes stop_codon:yes gene_type:complete
MSEEKSINEELLEIIKALSSKVESLEQAVYNKDNLLMKSGFVLSETPTPAMVGVVGTDVSSVNNTANMDWKDIHKMVSKME